MLTDWISWLYSMPQAELIFLLCPLILFDSARYSIAALSMWTVDAVSDAWSWLRGGPQDEPYTYCPTVCVVVAGLNEADGLVASLNNFWGTYPKLEIVVVDDGSTDGMSDVANEFASTHANVRVLTKRRGGKSSAMNAALPLTNAEIIVILDADSGLASDAIWEIVQPLADPRVGAVAGNVMVRNSSKGLITFIQSYEYLRSILVGRMFAARMGVLGIVSGAFGAFRKTALDRVGAWDVGPGEDEDIVLRLRKLGYRIEFAPYASCYTDAPERWKVLTKQRRRWEWAVVTFESRKHIDMVNPRSATFRLSNLLLFFERWLFSLLLPLWCWVYLAWLLFTVEISHLINVTILYYLAYSVLEIVQFLIVLYYSDHKLQHARHLLLLPILPLYQFYQRCVTTWAIVEEMLLRRSFSDGFVPAHVRNATWKW